MAPPQEDYALERQVSKVLALSRVGYFDIDLTTTTFSFDTIHSCSLDEGRLRQLTHNMSQLGVLKYRSPLIVLIEDDEFSNKSSARVDHDDLVILEHNAKELCCVSGMHRLGALERIRHVLEDEIERLEKVEGKNKNTLERKRSQLAEYNTWPALLYIRCKRFQTPATTTADKPHSKNPRTGRKAGPRRSYCKTDLQQLSLVHPAKMD